MFPPQPTKVASVLLNNLWGTLKRAADWHWAEQATLDHSPEGIHATLRLQKGISDQDWKLVSKIIRQYNRESHWQTKELRRFNGYVGMVLEYSPPKEKKPRPHPEQRPASVEKKE